MENLQLGPRGVVLVLARQRKKSFEPNNLRREVESGANYYDSERNYTSFVWDNPVLHGDSLV